MSRARLPDSTEPPNSALVLTACSLRARRCRALASRTAAAQAHVRRSDWTLTLWTYNNCEQGARARCTDCGIPARSLPGSRSRRWSTARLACSTTVESTAQADSKLPVSTRRMSSKQFARNRVTEMSITDSYMAICEHASPVVPGRGVPRSTEYIEEQGATSRKTQYNFGLVEADRLAVRGVLQPLRLRRRRPQHSATLSHRRARSGVVVSDHPR